MLLKENQVIKEQTYQFALTVIDELLGNKFVETVEELDVFITHLAMAVERQLAQDAVGELDNATLTELADSPHIKEVMSVWQQLARQAPVSFPAAEVPYMYIHLCTICSQREGM